MHTRQTWPKRWPSTSWIILLDRIPVRRWSQCPCKSISSLWTRLRKREPFTCKLPGTLLKIRALLWAMKIGLKGSSSCAHILQLTVACLQPLLMLDLNVIVSFQPSRNMLKRRGKQFYNGLSNWNCYVRVWGAELQPRKKSSRTWGLILLKLVWQIHQMCRKRHPPSLMENAVTRHPSLRGLKMLWKSVGIKMPKNHGTLWVLAVSHHHRHLGWIQLVHLLISFMWHLKCRLDWRCDEASMAAAAFAEACSRLFTERVCLEKTHENHRLVVTLAAGLQNAFGAAAATCWSKILRARSWSGSLVPAGQCAMSRPRSSGIDQKSCSMQKTMSSKLLSPFNVFSYLFYQFSVHLYVYRGQGLSDLRSWCIFVVPCASQSIFFGHAEVKWWRRSKPQCLHNDRLSSTFAA